MAGLVIFLLGFMGAGGRLPKARRGRVLLSNSSSSSSGLAFVVFSPVVVDVEPGLGGRPERTGLYSFNFPLCSAYAGDSAGTTQPKKGQKKGHY